MRNDTQQAMRAAQRRSHGGYPTAMPKGFVPPPSPFAKLKEALAGTAASGKVTVIDATGRLTQRGEASSARMMAAAGPIVPPTPTPQWDPNKSKGYRRWIAQQNARVRSGQVVTR